MSDTASILSGEVGSLSAGLTFEDSIPPSPVEGNWASEPGSSPTSPSPACSQSSLSSFEIIEPDRVESSGFGSESSSRVESGFGSESSSSFASCCAGNIDAPGTEPTRFGAESSSREISSVPTGSLLALGLLGVSGHGSLSGYRSRPSSWRGTSAASEFSFQSGVEQGARSFSDVRRSASPSILSSGFSSSPGARATAGVSTSPRAPYTRRYSVLRRSRQGRTGATPSAAVLSLSGNRSLSNSPPSSFVRCPEVTPSSVPPVSINASRNGRSFTRYRSPLVPLRTHEAATYHLDSDGQYPAGLNPFEGSDSSSPSEDPPGWMDVELRPVTDTTITMAESEDACRPDATCWTRWKDFFCFPCRWGRWLALAACSLCRLQVGFFPSLSCDLICVLLSFTYTLFTARGGFTNTQVSL